MPTFDELTALTRTISGVTPENGNADDNLVSLMNCQTEVISAIKYCLSDYRALFMSGEFKQRYAYEVLRKKVMGNWQNEALLYHLKAFLDARNLKSEIYSGEGKKYLIMAECRENNNQDSPERRSTVIAFQNILNNDPCVPDAELTDEPMTYLLTMDPGITEAELEELRLKKIQPVVPRSVQRLYNVKKAFWFMSVEELLLVLSEKQEGWYGN